MKREKNQSSSFIQQIHINNNNRFAFQSKLIQIADMFISQYEKFSNKQNYDTQIRCNKKTSFKLPRTKTFVEL